ncbi:MAG TPA: M28 family peptidase [Candidatus Thermoplasmatota archaeon]|nr:M28 family peptidase [Candidatus Thermoplasmatota archaeon]
MRKKCIGVFVCVLLIIAIVSGVQAIQDNIDIKEKNNLSALSNPQPSNHNSMSDMDDVIIDIIQNINEPLYLSYLENITAFGPRVTGTPSCYDAGTYLYNEFQSMGLAVRYQNWNNGGYQDRNIEATLPGTNETSDEIYIICGHFDTVSNCPGADDDASGVATVLIAAYLLSECSVNHTIRFVAFSGEEQWMLGSHEYVEEAVQNGDNIAAVLNVDMIGYALTQDQGSKIKIYDNGNPRWVTNFTVNISQIYYEYIQLTAIPSGFTYSDQYYFWVYGYEAIFYHEYKFNDYYHTSQDTIANMNISYATKCSRLCVATLAALAEILSSSNNPPETPDKPLGPTAGNIQVDYTFSTQTIDHESQQIYYLWYWGNEMSEWMGPYESGETVQAVHRWTSEGTYDVKVLAKDTDDAISGWSEPLTVTIVGAPFIEIGEVTGGFGIHVEIKNIGNADALNVDWKITLQGFVFFGRESSGSFVKIVPGFTPTASTGFIFGIGPVGITITARSEGLNPVETKASALVFGPFVFRVT